MCSALDLPEQDNEPGRPYIAFSATKVTPTAASTQIEKGARPFGPLPINRPAPRSWPFVERSKPTISLGEQDKPDVTHTHERANVDGVSSHGTALITFESPGVEQKPHEDDNQATVLVDSEASGNYVDESPSLDYTEDALDENYVSSEEILRDVHDCTAALDLNIEILADHDDPPNKSPRGGVSPSGGVRPEEPVSSFLPWSLLAPTSTASSASAPTSAPAQAALKSTTGRALVAMFHLTVLRLPLHAAKLLGKIKGLR